MHTCRGRVVGVRCDSIADTLSAVRTAHGRSDQTGGGRCVVEVLPAVRAATQLVRTRRGALATQTDAPCCMLRIACQGRWWLMVGFG